LTAVKFSHSYKLLTKNLKLALLKQSGFLDAKNFSAFVFAEVLPHSSGNASRYSEARASVNLPRRKNITVYKELGRDKSKAFTLINASLCDSHRNIYRAEWRFVLLVKKIQLFECNEFWVFSGKLIVMKVSDSHPTRSR